MERMSGFTLRLFTRRRRREGEASAPPVVAE
jgi:hypothetical protein